MSYLRHVKWKLWSEQNLHFKKLPFKATPTSGFIRIQIQLLASLITLPSSLWSGILDIRTLISKFPVLDWLWERDSSRNGWFLWTCTSLTGGLRHTLDRDLEQGWFNRWKVWDSCNLSTVTCHGAQALTISIYNTFQWKRNERNWATAQMCPETVIFHLAAACD